MGNARGVLQDGTSIKIRVEKGRVTDPLPDTLVELDCSCNNLIKLPVLPETILKLYCYVNSIRWLQTLPNKMTELDCSWNKIQELPTLPETLVRLDCSYNSLTVLPTLPETLVSLDCSNNNLTALPTLPERLEELFCRYNMFLDSESIFTSKTGKVFVRQNERYYSDSACGMTSEKAKQLMVDLECYDAIQHFGL